jgi:hypothetical protein
MASGISRATGLISHDIVAVEELMIGDTFNCHLSIRCFC